MVDFIFFFTSYPAPCLSSMLVSGISAKQITGIITIVIIIYMYIYIYVLKYTKNAGSSWTLVFRNDVLM